ncbi:MAG: thiamine diphosphokinase [Rickettsiaceae bacterium]
MINSLPPYTTIIVANGNLIKCNKILNSRDVFIVATDGGYDKCRQLNITPNIVIGDRDSLVSKNCPNYLYVADQNTTDLEKAILYCKDRGMHNILMLGICGGELDHALNNIMLITKYLDSNMQFTIYDQYDDNRIKISYLLNQGQLRFTCAKHATISILPLPIAKISTTGLKWELNEELLNLDTHTSVRNSAAIEDIKINCLSGKSIVIVDYAIDDMIHRLL